MTDTLCSFILCGGAGSRLWPLSRADNPKQMLSLVGDHSMLRATVDRVNNDAFAAFSSNVSFIGNISHRAQLEKTAAQAEVEGCSILLEPFGRNTALAVAVATIHAISKSPTTDPFVLIMPSDHVIETPKLFAATVTKGLEAARSGQIVVFGIQPDKPVTGYGYIEVTTQNQVSPVARFVEKPDLETAKAYLESGNFLWNAGIFLFQASAMVTALQEHAPDILESARATLNASSENEGTLLLDQTTYGDARSESIDYAVMEKISNVTAVRAAFDWNDIGSFEALRGQNAANTSENVTRGDVVCIDGQGNYLRSEGPLLTALGIDNLTIVATPDATFVAPVNRSEEVKRIVADLEKNSRPEIKRTPWLAECGVKPGAMADRFQNWLFTSALPFWAENGIDHTHGGFHEVLDLEGQSTAADKRLRTMARQTYVYAKAMQMGWDGDAQSVVEHGLEFLEQSPASPTGGWFKTFDAQSKPIDQTEDTYDHAFVLLALATAKSAGFKRADAQAKRVLATLDKLLVASDPQGNWNGYEETSTAGLPRRSNPHMHMLEAMLAWYEASGDDSALEIAAKIAGLFQKNFYQSDTMFLGEEFDKELHITQGGTTYFEPGHHFEWAWLLGKYARLSGTKPMFEIRGLYTSAKAFGTNPVSQLAYDAVATDGRPLSRQSRCWPQTEMLKAAASMSAIGLGHSDFEIERAADKLWKHYLAPATQGMWNDVCNVSGRPIATTVPASTFYHLICCIDVYLQHFKRL